MPEAEEVEITTMINKCTNTQQLDEELHQQGDDTKITVLQPELINEVFESSAKTILEHGEDDITKETTLFDSRTVFGAEEVETNTSIDLNKTPQLSDELHEHDDEIGISFPSTELMDVVEAKNIVSMEEANNGLQQVEEFHGSSSQADVTEETTFVNDKTMREAEDVENATVINQDTNTLQLVEELDQQGNEPKLTVLHPELINEAFESSAETILEHVEDDISKETTLFDAKTDIGAEEVETNTSIDLATNNTPQLLDEPHEQDDETGISFPSTNLSNKVNESYAETLSEHGEMENHTSSYQATNPGELAEDLPQQVSEAEVTICSVEVSQKLSVEEVRILPNDEHDNTILIDHVNNHDLQIVEESCQYDTTLSDEIVIATVKPRNDDGIENPISTGQATNETHLSRLSGGLSQQGHEPELGTVSIIEVLVEEMKATKESHMVSVERDDQKHGKTNLNKKNIKIAEELKSLNLELCEKLKKIEELAEHVLAIDTEISQMEFKCRESKGNHADFIDLYKFMAESQLPLRSHREIKLFMKKMDKEAQLFMSNALDLQFNIEARAKLKLSLQEERKELEKLVEAQKLQMQQKLNEFTGKKFEEAVDPDIESQSIKITTNCFRKRKADHQEDLVEELRAPLQAKRMAFDVVTGP